MGLLYVVIPVKDTGDGEFSKSPRVRNLLFLGAPILAMFGVWEKAGISFDRTAAFSFYLAGVAPTIILLFVVTSTFIYFDRRRTRRHHRETFADLHFFWWVWMFLINPSRYGREVVKDRDAVVQHRKDLEAGQVGRIAQASGTLGLLIKSVGSATDNNRQTLTDELLAAISSVATMATRTPERVKLEANYMDVVPITEATKSEIGSVKFQWPPRNEWTHLLVLRRYTGRLPPRPFALAIAVDAPMSEVPCGAPDAYVRGRPIYVDTNLPEFASGIPRDKQATIRRYLNEAPFETFVSIPIVHSSGTIGIVNIESNLPYVLGESDAVLNLALGCVAPYCSLLGQLMAQRRSPG